MPNFYIMRASHIVETSRKVTLTTIINKEPDCTILATTRRRNFDSTVPTFVIGCRSNYGVKPGNKVTYTVDTGNGYRERDQEMIINHVIQVKDGKIESIDGDPSGQMIDDFKRCYPFVMK